MVVVGTEVVEVGSVEEVVVGVVVLVVDEVVVLVGVVDEVVLVVDEVVVLEVEVVESSSPALTTASATPRPITAATRTTITAFNPELMPWRGGSPPPRPSLGGGTSMRRVGSSCTGGECKRRTSGVRSATMLQCLGGDGCFGWFFRPRC